MINDDNDNDYDYDHIIILETYNFGWELHMFSPSSVSHTPAPAPSSSSPPPPLPSMENGSPQPSPIPPFSSPPFPSLYTFPPIGVALPPVVFLPPPVATTLPSPPSQPPSSTPPTAPEAPPPTQPMPLPPPPLPSTPVAPSPWQPLPLPPPPTTPEAPPPRQPLPLSPPPPPTTPETSPPPPPSPPFSNQPAPSPPWPPPLPSPFSNQPAPPSPPPPSSFMPPTFQSPPPPPSLPLANGSSLSKNSKQSHISVGLIAGCVIAGVFLLVVLGLICLCSRKRRFTTNHKHPTLKPKYNNTSEQKEKGKIMGKNSHWAGGAYILDIQGGPFSSTGRDRESSLEIQTPGPSNSSGFLNEAFTYDELAAATDGFSETNLIGEGGFGYVHIGILKGQQVAIKQLKEGSRQGELEFIAEVEIISRVHHKHLVSLMGYCISDDKRLLVYEFLPNKTLAFHLHGIGQPTLKWDIRLKIARGSAKGLAYLHEDCNPTIIHRDIKATNILLDNNFEPKVSDFGLAKSYSDATTGTTSISTRVVGTFGYLAPEYVSSGKVNVKSDVYSYGVMLLELITGHAPTSIAVRVEGLVNWARSRLPEALEHGNFKAIVDPRLENNYSISEMTSMVACAAACVRKSSKLRPQMSKVVRALEGDISAMDLYERSKSPPPEYSTLYGSVCSDYVTAQHNNTAVPMANPQYGTIGYSGTTSEYGLDPSISSTDSSNVFN